MRYAIFVHDPDGDMGYGQIVGPFNTLETAEAKADGIRRVSRYQTEADGYGEQVEAIILPLMRGNAAAMAVAKAVINPTEEET
jgi:hypothetical protein